MLHLRHDLKLVNDKANYALGPHTDQPSKVICIILSSKRLDSERNRHITLYSKGPKAH